MRERAEAVLGWAIKRPAEAMKYAREFVNRAILYFKGTYSSLEKLFEGFARFGMTRGADWRLRISLILSRQSGLTHTHTVVLLCTSCVVALTPRF